jgi:hypothetical protein
VKAYGRLDVACNNAGISVAMLAWLSSERASDMSGGFTRWMGGISPLKGRNAPCLAPNIDASWFSVCCVAASGPSDGSVTGSVAGQTL